LTVVQRITRFPYSVEDNYYNHIENLSNLAEMFTDQCFTKCSEVEDVPCLTIQEGLCFRNCMTKFCTWYPTLKANLVDAPHTFHEDKLHNHLLANNADYAEKTFDPAAELLEGIRDLAPKTFKEYN
jgi:hypothetical protein